MKLLKQNPDGSLQVLDTEFQLRGVLDAFGVASKLGDGGYIADMMDGSYLPFQIVDGQPPQGLTIDAMQYGKPYETTAEGERFRESGAAGFHTLTSDVVGQDEQPGNAYDDYVSSRQVG